MGFLTQYQAVFTAVKTALGTKASIKSIILGESFSLGDLPKAIINAEGGPISQAAMGELLSVKINFNVIVVIREYDQANWFTDLIPVMSDVEDAILADRTLGGAAFDCVPLGFYPGEIHFEDKVLCGGAVHFCAEILYSP